MKTMFCVVAIMAYFAMMFGCSALPESVPSYTVVFVTGEGGSTVASQTIALGAKVTQPATPSKAGFSFEGWYKDAEGDSPF